MKRSLSGQRFLHGLLFTGLLLTELLNSGGPTTGVTASSTYNFIANQRPRFKIPRGNLSYYRNPHWEILYFLKFGTFPVYTPNSPYLNRTEYLTKLRQIKNVLDESSRESDYSLMTALQPNSVQDSDYSLTLDLESPFPEDFSKKKKLFQAAATEVYQNNQKHQRPLHFTAPQPLTSGVGMRASSAKRGTGTGKKEQAPVDYFLVDTDPTWIRNRVTKQAGSDFEGAGSGGLFSEGEGDGSVGGLAAEMTIDRKVNRKFQTQGW